MSDVAIILLVVYAMVGIGYAIGLVDDEDGYGIQTVKFIISFLLWPMLMGFKTGDDKW